MLRYWSADLRTRALALHRVRTLMAEAVALLRPDRRRQIDAVIDYFGEPPVDKTRRARRRRAARLAPREAS